MFQLFVIPFKIGITLFSKTSQKFVVLPEYHLWNPQSLLPSWTGRLFAIWMQHDTMVEPISSCIVFLRKVSMCFIAENGHSQIALVSGKIKSDFANLSTSDIKCLWPWFFLKITQHFDYLSSTIEISFEPANRKVTQLYLGLFIGNRFRIYQQLNWSTSYKNFDYITLQIHLGCFCGVEIQVSGSGQWFHKWPYRLLQNKKLTQIFCWQSSLNVDTAGMLEKTNKQTNIVNEQKKGWMFLRPCLHYEISTFEYFLTIYRVNIYTYKCIHLRMYTRVSVHTETLRKIYEYK